MSPARLFHLLLAGLLPLLVLGLPGQRAMAQADPPSRVARVNHLEGAAVFSPAGDDEWTDAVLNRPLTRGDRVWTDRGARADVQVGSSAVRMDGQTQLEILALDDRSAQLSVTQGTVYARVRSLPEGENFELDTPNLAFRAAYPGDYRIDVNAATGTTRVTIHSGTGAVYGESGQVLSLGGGQQVTFRARDLSRMATGESPPQDNFDRWAAERNRREDQSVSARHVPREVVGYQHLDAHGLWMQDADFGSVWFPQGLATNWAPYRQGHWDWIAPWGWTWIDDATWGFAPFHYGRWAMIDSRWAWVPGRIAIKPVYSPALVAFIGKGGGALDWSLSLGAGKQIVSWFPLAPGEAWQPGYPASPPYMSTANGDVAVQSSATYAHQRKPEALTSISAEDFHRGPPGRAGWLRVAANTLANARIVPPPPMPEHFAVTRKPAVARAAPVAQSKPQGQAAAPLPPDSSSVAALPADSSSVAALPARPEQRSEQRSEQRPKQRPEPDSPAKPTAAKEQQAPVVQTKVAQPSAKPQESWREKPARRAEPARLEVAARRAEQGKREQQAKLVEQARREQATRQLELARQTAQAQREQDRKQAREQAARELAKREQAKREQARRDMVAKKAEQSRREDQARREATAKREEQTHREAFAKREENARREAIARRQEQTRREAVAKRQEQTRREAVAKREEQTRREAVAQREEQQRREAHAKQVEQARRAADRDAAALREQREQREEMQARREAQERESAQQREQAQRAAWARQQQALGEQWRRDHEAWEQQQRARARQRPDLRDDRRLRPAESQRGIPIISGPWS